MAAMVSSTKPDSLSVSVWMATCTSNWSATRKAAVDGGGRRAPILVQLQAAGAGADLLLQRPRQTAVALAEEAEVDRASLGRLQHALHVPGARRAGGGVGAGGRAGAAADQRRQAGGEGGFDQLRADEMNVAVDAAGRDDQVLAGDDLGAGADDQLRIDAGLDERVAGLADADDAALADADVALDDAPVVEDDGVGDDQIERRFAALAGQRRLALAVADDLAAAELDLLAVDGEVLLDLDDQLGVGQANAVAGGGAIVAGVGGAGQMARSSSPPGYFLFFLLDAHRLAVDPCGQPFQGCVPHLGSSTSPITRPLPP